MNDDQIMAKLSQIIRVGVVNARQPEKMRVKVTIPDTVGKPLITDFLPVLTPRACEDMQYDLPDIGDQVLCLFLAYGLEQGCVIGAMYGKQTPPVQSGDKWHRTFKDGATLEYDRENHALNASIPGTATIKCEGPITLEAPIVYVRGTLVNTAKDGSPGKSVFSGGMTVTDGGVSVPDADVQASGVSLTSHTTDGVQPGGGQSLHPTGGSSTSPGTATQGGNSGDSGSGSDDGDSDSSGSSETGSEGLGGLPDAGSLAGGIAGALLANSQKHLEALADEVADTGSSIDKLIMCLPEIAAAMAAKAESEGDKQGWLYLKAMFEKWLSGAANENTATCANSLWVSWDWAMSYTRPRAAYVELTSRELQEGTIYSLRAMQKLGAILCKKGYLNPKREIINFDFTDSNPARWEDLYFTLREVGYDGNALSTQQGLYAAMGNFSLRALAGGSAENLGGGRWRITLKKASVFIHDQFNFAGPEFLGFWSCEHLDGARKMRWPGYRGLTNSDFREFREKFGRGADFLVLSKPHPVEDMKEASYVTTCSE